MEVNKNINRKQILVKGAKLHNLKNIDVEIPHGKFTVITGVSGSGKSTLAFDTIYAEGQRRFVESLSSYARQFLERMHKPDVDSITGLPPAIAIEQRQSARNPRSTVGTTTEVYDYLRLLYGRIGYTVCKDCGKIIHKDTPDSIVADLIARIDSAKSDWNSGDKLYILFPLPAQTKNIEEELNRLKTSGYFRIFINDSAEIIDLESSEIPKDLLTNRINILADRLVLRNDEESQSRIAESLESALNAGKGRLFIRNLTNGKTLKFSSLYECPDCEIEYTEPEPRLFSFNNPYGACPNCQGFGRTIGIDEDLVIPDKTKSIKNNAIHPFKTPGYSVHLRELLRIAPRKGISSELPYQALCEKDTDIIWNGSGEYIGINGFFKELEEKNYKVSNRVMLSRYRGYTKCRHCGGSRLRTSARQVYVEKYNIPELIKMPLEKVLEFFNNLKLTEYQTAIADQIVKEIKSRLSLLVDIGLHYLTLDRLSHTLSGGEAQRINLATALGSSLVGTLYVLDEPSIGMHQRDTKRLLDILFKLRNLGNTIIVVEHDPEIMRSADYIIDIGPKAGEHGGKLIYSGNTIDILTAEESVTGNYLSGKKKINVLENKKSANGKKLTVIKPRENNLKIDKVSFPIGCMTVVTGVSGSGKSTLINDVLYPAIKKQRGGYDGATGSYEAITGLEYIDSIQMVDQSSIGKSSRSTPATYTKVFDSIRDLFASTQASKQMGWKSGYFSFNVPGGRCEVCEGEGTVTVDMQFLSDVHLECESCKGTRYKKEAQLIEFRGKNIVDVLNMTIDEALHFFKDNNKVSKKLQILHDVGLGYLQLGQPSTMLSGGESQRIKLASHLESNTENTLYIFDEPTTGLHLDDISKLLECFRRLTDKGHTVIIIEHNLHVIASADWIIDLGPEAGDSGGKIVATGTPEKIAGIKDSHTGIALKEFFAL